MKAFRRASITTSVESDESEDGEDDTNLMGLTDHCQIDPAPELPQRARRRDSLSSSHGVMHHTGSAPARRKYLSSTLKNGGAMHQGSVHQCPRTVMTLESRLSSFVSLPELTARQRKKAKKKERAERNFRFNSMVNDVVGVHGKRKSRRSRGKRKSSAASKTSKSSNGSQGASKTNIKDAEPPNDTEACIADSDSKDDQEKIKMPLQTFFSTCWRSPFGNWTSKEGVVEITTDGKIKIFKGIKQEDMLLDFPSVPRRTISLSVISDVIEEPCGDVEGEIFGDGAKRMKRRASTGNSPTAGYNLTFVSTRRGEQGICLGYDTDNSDEDSDSDSSDYDYDSDSDDDAVLDEDNACEVEELVKPPGNWVDSEIDQSNDDDWSFVHHDDDPDEFNRPNLDHSLMLRQQS
jgi:hypothetical protein